MGKINVTVWNEFLHEKEERIKAVYPIGIHGAIAEGLKESKEFNVRTATLEEPEHGLTEEVLASTDVLFWWGHMGHAKVADAIVDRVQKRVLEGMGLIVLHSGHFSKIFRRMLGTNCSLKWREADEREILWNIEPSHPIAEGIGDHFELPAEEMYGERFDIPTPDKVVFIGWFEGGDVFRSGVTFERGHGRIFYFQPGHESYPTYYNKQIRQILRNAAKWAAPRITKVDCCPNEKDNLAPIAKKSVTYAKAGVVQTEKDLK